MGTWTLLARDLIFESPPFPPGREKQLGPQHEATLISLGKLLGPLSPALKGSAIFGLSEGDVDRARLKGI